MNLPKRSNPFSAQEALPAKPWPRAVLPGANTGAFTASYLTGETRSFYPFEPRAVPEVQAAAGESQH